MARKTFSKPLFIEVVIFQLTLPAKRSVGGMLIGFRDDRFEVMHQSSK
jgi:hypothetical protein